MKHLALWILVILFLFSIAGCEPSSTSKQDAEAHSSILDQILSAGVIRVGTTGDYMPYSYTLVEGDSIYHGVDIELARDLAKSLGVELHFVQTTWPNLMADLESNLFDIGMSGITITLERQKKALFSLAFSSGGKAAITRDEDVEKYDTLEEINQQEVRVIVNPGGTNETFTRNNFPQATLILNEDNLSVFQKIIDGEADVMVTDAIETIVQEMIHPELEAANPDRPFNFFEKGYLLPVDHTFKAYVDQWVRLRIKDGTYQKIFEEELSRIEEQNNP